MLLANLTSHELTELQALDALEPLGSRGADAQRAYILAMMATRWAGEHGEPVEQEQAMPAAMVQMIERRADEQHLSAQERGRRLLAAGAMGG